MGDAEALGSGSQLAACWRYNAYMALAIRQIVTVRAAGVLEVRSPDLHPGDQAEVTVVVTPKAETATHPPTDGGGGSWRDLAGAINTGDPRSSDNERIDADLADEYQYGAAAPVRPPKA